LNCEGNTYLGYVSFKLRKIMKRTTKLTLALLAGVIALTMPTLANSGLIHRTVASDSPYRQAAAKPVATTTGTKFQIAPVKMETATPAANTAAPVNKVAHSARWR
jgi:hypothetical protein